MAIVKKWIVNGMRLSLEKHDELPGKLWYTGYVERYVGGMGLDYSAEQHLNDTCKGRKPKFLEQLGVSAGQISYVDIDGFSMEVGFDTAHARYIPALQDEEFLIGQVELLAQKLDKLFAEGKVSLEVI